MRKATTIKGASCSRPALSAVVSDFKGGMSVYQTATKYGLLVETVENVIRQALKLQGRTA